LVSVAAGRLENRFVGLRRGCGGASPGLRRGCGGLRPSAGMLRRGCGRILWVAMVCCGLRWRVLGSAVVGLWRPLRN
jgi:hypothetical protein